MSLRPQKRKVPWYSLAAPDPAALTAVAARIRDRGRDDERAPESEDSSPARGGGTPGARVDGAPPGGEGSAAPSAARPAVAAGCDADHLDGRVIVDQLVPSEAYALFG